MDVFRALFATTKTKTKTTNNSILSSCSRSDDGDGDGDGSSDRIDNSSSNSSSNNNSNNTTNTNVKLGEGDHKIDSSSVTIAVTATVAVEAAAATTNVKVGHTKEEETEAEVEEVAVVDEEKDRSKFSSWKENNNSDNNDNDNEFVPTTNVSSTTTTSSSNPSSSSSSTSMSTMLKDIIDNTDKLARMLMINEEDKQSLQLARVENTDNNKTHDATRPVVVSEGFEDKLTMAKDITVTIRGQLNSVQVLFDQVTSPQQQQQPQRTVSDDDQYYQQQCFEENQVDDSDENEKEELQQFLAKQQVELQQFLSNRQKKRLYSKLSSSLSLSHSSSMSTSVSVVCDDVKTSKKRSHDQNDEENCCAKIKDQEISINIDGDDKDDDDSNDSNSNSRRIPKRPRRCSHYNDNVSSSSSSSSSVSTLIVNSIQSTSSSVMNSSKKSSLVFEVEKEKTVEGREDNRIDAQDENVRITTSIPASFTIEEDDNNTSNNNTMNRESRLKLASVKEEDTLPTITAAVAEDAGDSSTIEGKKQESNNEIMKIEIKEKEGQYPDEEKETERMDILVGLPRSSSSSTASFENQLKGYSRPMAPTIQMDEERPSFLHFWDNAEDSTMTAAVTVSIDSTTQHNNNNSTASSSANHKLSNDGPSLLSIRVAPLPTKNVTVRDTDETNDDDNGFNNEKEEMKKSKEPQPMDIPLSLSNLYWNALNSRQPREGAWYLHMLIDKTANNQIPSKALCKEFMNLLTFGPHKQHHDYYDHRLYQKIQQKQKRQEDQQQTTNDPLPPEDTTSGIPLDTTKTTKKRKSTPCSSSTKSIGLFVNKKLFYWDGPCIDFAMNIWKRSLRLYPEVLLARMIECSPTREGYIDVGCRHYNKNDNSGGGGRSIRKRGPKASSIGFNIWPWWKIVLYFDDMKDTGEESIDFLQCITGTKSSSTRRNRNNVRRIKSNDSANKNNNNGCGSGDDDDATSCDDAPITTQINSTRTIEDQIGLLQMRLCRLDALTFLLESSIAYEREKKEEDERKLKPPCKDNAIDVNFGVKKKREIQRGITNNDVDRDSNIKGDGDDSVQMNDSVCDSDSDNDDTRNRRLKSASISSLILLHQIRLNGADALDVVAKALASLWVYQRYYLGFRDANSSNSSHDNDEDNGIHVNLNMNEIFDSGQYELWQECNTVGWKLAQKMSTILKLVRAVLQMPYGRRDYDRCGQQEREVNRFVSTDASIVHKLWQAMNRNIQENIRTNTKKSLTGDEDCIELVDPVTKLLVNWIYCLQDSMGDNFAIRMAMKAGVTTEYHRSMNFLQPHSPPPSESRHKESKKENSYDDNDFGGRQSKLRISDKPTMADKGKADDNDGKDDSTVPTYDINDDESSSEDDDGKPDTHSAISKPSFLLSPKIASVSGSNSNIRINNRHTGSRKEDALPLRKSRNSKVEVITIDDSSDDEESRAKIATPLQSIAVATAPKSSRNIIDNSKQRKRGRYMKRNDVSTKKGKSIDDEVEIIEVIHTGEKLKSKKPDYDFSQELDDGNEERVNSRKRKKGRKKFVINDNGVITIDHY